MKSWQEDLLDLVSGNATCEREIFRRIEDAAIGLGFEHVAYGFQSSLPLSRPKITLLNNYPRSWQERYAHAGYLQIDPTVAHGRRSQAPIIWADQVFADAQSFWDEAREHGLRVGWAQSSRSRIGGAGMLTLSRSTQLLSEHELEANQQKMRWLVQVAHIAFSRTLTDTSVGGGCNLTGREIEVLKWTADGKSAQDIADIFAVSKNTVDFHIKNSVAKLNVSNKTAAVVRAVLLGFLC